MVRNSWEKYYEEFLEIILHFYHFFELILKELLKKEHELLPLEIPRNSETLIKIIKNKPSYDNKVLKFNSLTFSSLLEKT